MMPQLSIKFNIYTIKSRLLSEDKNINIFTVHFDNVLDFIDQITGISFIRIF